MDVINIASLQCRTLSESVNFEFVVLQPVNLSSCTGLISYNGLSQFSFPRVWTLSVSQSVSLNLLFPACDSVNLSSYMILD